MAMRADRVGVRQDQVDVHGRVTSPSFLNELLEDLPEWTDMPVWVNGTEEVLPSNTSVPVTSPILADIAYPDIRRDNQYFTYRESPTPVDGLAKIKSIKGNTLVWNQLIQNGNFVNTDSWSYDGGISSISVASNKCTVNFNSASEYNKHIKQSFSYISGHKYLFIATVKSDAPTGFQNVRFRLLDGNTGTPFHDCSTRTTFSYVFDCTSTMDSYLYISFTNGAYGGTATVENVMAIDLTKLGVDSITDYASFASLFGISYYAYNAGTLLSFTGTGIKTAGKNLISNYYTNTAINESGNRYSNNSALTTNEIFVFENRTLVASGTKQGNWFVHKFKNGVYAGYSSISNSVAFTLETGVTSIIVQYNNSNEGTVLPVEGMVEFGSTASEYEAYTSQTTSLPISTYFPTGMKSAGTVYDELTPTKGITRTGAVDLGSLTWTLRDNAYWQTQSNAIPNAKIPSDNIQPINAIHSVYEIKGGYYVQSANQIGMTTTGVLNCNNGSTTDKPSGYLFYELATPVELPTMSFE